MVRELINKFPITNFVTRLLLEEDGEKNRNKIHISFVGTFVELYKTSKNSVKLYA